MKERVMKKDTDKRLDTFRRQQGLKTLDEAINAALDYPMGRKEKMPLSDEDIWLAIGTKFTFPIYLDWGDAYPVVRHDGVIVAIYCGGDIVAGMPCDVGDLTARTEGGHEVDRDNLDSLSYYTFKSTPWVWEDFEDTDDWIGEKI